MRDKIHATRVVGASTPAPDPSPRTRERMVNAVNILAVAPYEGLAAVLEREVRTYPDVNMTIVVGNLEEGLTAAIEQLIEPYDLILSRGGTADLLRDNLDIPVIDIKTSAFDVLQALQLSEGITGKRAVVGFPGIADPARNTSDVLQLDLDIFTLLDEEDISDIAQLLWDRGFETVLCDVISSTAFRERGFNTILITSGAASVRQSIDEAIRMTRHIRDARQENLFFRQVVRGHSGDTVIFREDGRLFFTTLDKGGNEQLLQVLKDLLPLVLGGDASVIRRSLGGYQYAIRTMVSSIGDRTLVAFYIARSRMPSGQRQSGITFYTKLEANREYLDSPYSLTGDINGISKSLENASRAGKPILITGEYGTGRTAVAFWTYVNSQRSTHPFVEIDCGMLTDRSREFLLNGRSSPLFSNDLTLHVKNMETSPEAFINDLFSMLVNTDGNRRNSLIFSCNPQGERVGSYISYIKDKFQCLEVELPPLRESRERIPTIAKLYLSQLNADLPKEVLRIDRQAMALLSEYLWPGNYIQFKRILSQLCITSRDYTIRPNDVRSLLALERPVYPNSQTNDMGYGIDLDRPLTQIERDIIETVINRHGGNQSAAARSLGISRTTLWRMMKNASD